MHKLHHTVFGILHLLTERGHAQRIRLVALIAAVLLLSFAQLAYADERIHNFSIDVIVQADASLLVKESITLSAEHAAIQHGIFRVIPTLSWQDRRLRRYGVEFLEARLDGAPVPCQTEKGDLVTSFILGDPNTELAQGEHTFALTYRTKGHVRTHEGNYVLHYTATGTQWPFPIDMASVSITLPAGASLRDSSAYIVRDKERLDSVASETTTFATNRPLEPGEGLVIWASWQGGTITLPEPTLGEQLSAKGSLILKLVFLLPLCCFVLCWFFFRRVQKPVVEPIVSPPKDLSPGLAAMIAAKEENAARADLLWIAVRGFMRMQKNGKQWTFVPSWPRHLQHNWQNEACFAIADRLFSDRSDKSVTQLGSSMPNDWKAVESHDAERLSRALGGVVQRYVEEVQSNVSPFGWLLPLAGACINALMLYVAMYFVGWMGIYDGMNLTNYFLGIVLASLLAALPLVGLKKGCAQRIVLVVFWGLCVLLLGFWLDFDRQFWLPVLSCVFTPLLFWRFFPCRLTQKGLEMRAAVEGLAMHIRARGNNRLATRTVPEESVDHYEEILPYALALGLAEAWEKRFAQILSTGERSVEWIDDYRFLNREEKNVVSEKTPEYASALAAVHIVTAAYGATLHESSDADGGCDSGSSASTGGGGGGGW